MSSGRTAGTIRDSAEARRRASGNGRRQKAARLGLPPPMSPGEFSAMCRSLAPAAIEALRRALGNQGERVAAAKVLLDRGFGQALAKQEISGPDGAPMSVLTLSTEARDERLQELLAKVKAGG